MVSPSKALLQFQRQFCPNSPIDSNVIVYKLLEQISKMNNMNKCDMNERKFKS